MWGEVVERHSDYISVAQAGPSQHGGNQAIGRLLTEQAGDWFVRGKTCLFLKVT